MGERMYCVNTNLQLGDVLLLRSESKGSKIIALATSGHFSHAAIYVGNGMFIEAMPHGVTYLSAYRVLVKHKNNIIILRLNCDGNDVLSDVPRKAAARAVSYQIQPYALLSAIFSVTGGRPPKITEGMFCSYLVAQAYLEAGCSISNKPCYMITPNDFLRKPIANKFRCVTNEVLQECELNTESDLEPIDTGNHTRDIGNYSGAMLGIVKEANSVLREYGQQEVARLTDLISALVKMQSLRNIQEIDEKVSEIIDAKNMRQYLCDVASSIFDEDEDAYERALRLTKTKELPCDELPNEISHLRMLVDQKERIYREYCEMRDLLCWASSQSRLKCIGRFCDFYHDLVLLYAAYGMSFKKALSLLEDYQTKNCFIPNGVAF